MRIPSNQIYHVMTSFTRQLVNRLLYKDQPPSDGLTPSQNILTDRVRREAVLKQVTTEILSRITRLSPKCEGQADIRIQNLGDGNSKANTEEKRMVYDMIDSDGARVRRELKIAEPPDADSGMAPPPHPEK